MDWGGTFGVIGGSGWGSASLGFGVGEVGWIAWV